jgi:hypothetical protein
MQVPQTEGARIGGELVEIHLEARGRHEAGALASGRLEVA